MTPLAFLAIMLLGSAVSDSFDEETDIGSVRNFEKWFTAVDWKREGALKNPDGFFPTTAGPATISRSSFSVEHSMNEDPIRNQPPKDSKVQRIDASFSIIDTPDTNYDEYQTVVSKQLLEVMCIAKSIDPGMFPQELPCLEGMALNLDSFVELRQESVL